MFSSKYGLKNAGLLLQQIRSSHQKGSNSNVDNSSEEATFCADNVNGLTDQEPQTEEVKAEKEVESCGVEDQSSLFCDSVVIRHLYEMKATYQKDRAILADNMDNLHEDIFLLTEKIKKLPEISRENEALTVKISQKENLLRQAVVKLSATITAYHSARLKQQQFYNHYRLKIRMLLYQGDHSLQTDSYNAGFTSAWNSYVEWLLEFDRKLATLVQQAEQKPIQNDLLSQIFSSEYAVLLDKQLVKQGEKQKKSTEMLMSVDTVSSKLKQAQKSMMLGNLKSFAKNFKLP